MGPNLKLNNYSRPKKKIDGPVQFQIVTDKHPFKKLEFYFTAIIPISLAVFSIWQGLINSSQDVTIKKLDTLVHSHQSQIDFLAKLAQKLDSQLDAAYIGNAMLSEELNVLNRQLKINSDIQIRELRNENVKQNDYVTSLYSTCFTLEHIEPEIETWDSTEILTYMAKAKLLFERELNNPYLLSNDTISDYWFQCYKRILFNTAGKRNVTYVNDKGILQMNTVERNKAEFKEWSDFVYDVHIVIFRTVKYIQRKDPKLTFSIIKPRKIEFR